MGLHWIGGARERGHLPYPSFVPRQTLVPEDVPKVTVLGKKISIINVHEAGHALLYFLTRSEWGWDDPILHIEMGGDQEMPEAPGPGGVLATCFSHPFTPGMEKGLNITKAETTPKGELFFRAVKTVPRAEVEMWACGYILGSLAGPAAEAIYLGADIWETVMHPASCGDRGGARLAYDCLHGVTEETIDAEHFLNVMFRGAQRAAKIVQKYRKAVSKLAVALPRQGTFPGKSATAILRANITL